MDHVVYLDSKARELENLIKGTKSMIIRGAMGRKYPYGKLQKGDILYFIENKGDGLVKAKATITEVFNSEQLSPDESMELINNHQNKLLLDAGLLKRFGGKRYLVFISIDGFEIIKSFKIDKSAFSTMDDWLPVENINYVKII